ncbi:hypothetical protein ABBQ32_010012 [Trebouxia sp. C0010 RCD-2024]
MLQVVLAHGERFGSMRVQQAQQQQAWLADLQAGLLSGHCFQRFLSQRCGASSQVTQICGHQAFAQAVSGMIREQMQAAEDRIQAKAELADDRRQLLGLLCLAAAHSHICASLGLDKKLTKSLLDLHHKIPLLPVYCHLHVHPASFLSKMLPPAADRYMRNSYVQEALAEQKLQLELAMSHYPLEVQQARLTVLAWQAHMASLHTWPRGSEALLTKQAGALVRGVDLVAGLRNRLQVLLELHAAARQPITQQALALFVDTLSLVKGVQKTYEEHGAFSSPTSTQLIPHIRSGAQGLVCAMAAKVRAKQRQLASSGPSLLQFTSTRTAADKALKDAETACEAALQVLAGPTTADQLVMLDLCVDALKATAVISEHRMQTLDSAMHNLRTLIQLQAAVTEASDCSWLYYDSQLLEPILASLIKNPQQAQQLPYIMAAFLDAHSLLLHDPRRAEPRRAEPSQAGPMQAEPSQAGPSQAPPSQSELNQAEPSQADVPSLIQAYDEQLWSTLETVLLSPLCHRIESGLRLHHHAALLTGVPPLNPNSPDVLDVTPLLQVPALRLSTRVVHIRAYVEGALTASFRSYAAVTPHDWHAYEEMRSLAFDKHGLVVGAIDLPIQASDQRVDINAAIHDLPSFVAAFDYSMTGSMFLQQPAAAGRTAHLVTLSLQQASQAIQTHGPALIQQAQQSVCEFVTAQLQELRDVVAQEEVQIMLEAASAAVRASAGGQGQAGDDSSSGAAALHPAQHAQRDVLEPGSLTEDAAVESLRGVQGVVQSTGDLKESWLSRLSAERMVQFAEMVQTGLQEQQSTGSRQSCMDHLHAVIAGIGNAVGLLRSIQLGALQYRASVAPFVEGDAAEQSSSLGTILRQIEQCTTAGCALPAVLTQAHGSLKLQDQQRLQQVVPAATLAAAERAAEAKELTTKPRRQLPDQAQIFADGFAIGLAVLLEALEQHSTNDMMQWWTAFDASRSQQCEQLRMVLRTNQHTSTSNASEGGCTMYMGTATGQVVMTLLAVQEKHQHDNMCKKNTSEMK